MHSTTISYDYGQRVSTTIRSKSVGWTTQQHQIGATTYKAYTTVTTGSTLKFYNAQQGRVRC